MPADQTGRQSSKDAGEAAERTAEKFLRAHDMVCVERNYRCRLGEIDLIMQDGAALVFVEVRMRKNGGFGGAAASIGHAKQRRIIAAAQHYLSGLRTLPACRFDAVLLNDLNESGIEWIRDAFGT
jgi:putative endonuclease